MIKRICFLWPLLLVASLSFSQTITIKDKQSQTPIYLVTLSSDMPKAFTTTNKEGKADLKSFKGSEQIEIRIIGYKNVITSYSTLDSMGFELLLETSNFNLDKVVISATRHEQTSTDVPSQIATISPKEVQLHNPQTTADLLSLSGRVYIQKSQQGGGSPMIRGFATNRLLYTVDGIRMNTAIFREGNIQNVISLDPFSLENTEVLFGPGSVIYGSDAIGGVMSFTTITPQFSYSDNPLITGKALTRFSSANNEKSGHFDVNIGWKRWALVTSFSSFDFDHLRQGSHGPDDYLKPYYVERRDSVDVVIMQDDELLQIPSAYKQMNLMQKVRFQPNEHLDFQYGFHYSETSPYGRYDRHNRIKNGTPRYAEWNYGPQKWLMNNLNITLISHSKVFDQLTVRLAQQSFEESRIDRAFNNSNRSIRIEEVSAYSANIDFMKSTCTKNTLFYGLEYIFNDVTSTGIDENIKTGISDKGPSRYPQATWQSMAAYINNQHKLSDRFVLQTGARYNRFIMDAAFDTAFYPFPFTDANINNGAFTGSVGGVYRPSKRWIVNVNLATAFRSPNVDDIGKIYDSEPGAVVVPNPGLKAEYAYSADIGIAKLFGDVAKIDLAGYYTILNNALVRRSFTLNGADSIVYDGEMSKVLAVQNAAVALIYGIQGGFEIKLPVGINLSSDINFQLGVEEMDDGTTSPSRHAAPMFGSTKLSYRIKKTDLMFYAVYQGERKHKDMPVSEKEKTDIYATDANGNTYAPAWYTINVKALHQLTDELTVTAGIENITDRRYRSYSSGISAPGRNFFISLNMNF